MREIIQPVIDPEFPREVNLDLSVPRTLQQLLLGCIPSSPPARAFTNTSTPSKALSTEESFERFNSRASGPSEAKDREVGEVGSRGRATTDLKREEKVLERQLG